METVSFQSGQVSPGIKYYAVDTETDKDNLPIGMMGNRCYVIATKKWYILNSSGEWVPFVAEGGAVDADAILSVIDGMSDSEKSQLRSELGVASVFTFKGVVAAESDLPLSGNSAGDVYLVTEESSEYVWITTNSIGSLEIGRWEMLGSSGGDVTPASVLSALEGMDSEQQSDAREAMAAQTAVINVVTDFGAKGDGTTDDATSIQAALDAGGVVFFPAKTYRITQPVKFGSNTVLWFEPGATILQGAAINNLLRNKAALTDGGYTATSNVRIVGGTFDGGTYTENNTLVAFTHADGITIENCKFRNGYGEWHDIEVNSSRNVVIRHCSFDGSRRSGSWGETIQLDSLNNRTVYPFSDEGAIDSTPCEAITIEACKFNIYTTAIGHHNTIACQNVNITGNIFVGNGSSAKGIAFPKADALLITSNVFKNVIVPVGCYTYVRNASVLNNLFDTGTNGVVLYGGGNIIANNSFSGFTRPTYVVAASNVQTINDGNLITGNRADNCTNNYSCSNGVVSENYFNGVYSGVFAMQETVVTDIESTSITIADAVGNTIYEYGTLSSLTVTAIPASGDFIIRFTSGSTATTTSFPASMKFPEAFAADANTRYEINVSNGYALAVGWPTT